MKTAIIHDKPQCMGYGACVALDPESWSLEPEGRATSKQHQQEESRSLFHWSSDWLL